MPIYERARTRSRWPVRFDIEGVPRDNTIRQQKVEEHMQIAAVNKVGIFDFNNPPRKPYTFQEFPKRLYRGAEKLMVQDKAAEDAAVKAGWQLKPGEISALSAVRPEKKLPNR